MSSTLATKGFNKLCSSACFKYLTFSWTLTSFPDFTDTSILWICCSIISSCYIHSRWYKRGLYHTNKIGFSPGLSCLQKKSLSLLNIAGAVCFLKTRTDTYTKGEGLIPLESLGVLPMTLMGSGFKPWSFQCQRLL